MSMHTKQHTFRGSRARTAADTSFLGFISNFCATRFAELVFQPCTMQCENCKAGKIIFKTRIIIIIIIGMPSLKR